MRLSCLCTTTLLLGDTHGLSFPASGAGLLPSDSDSPPMSETSVHHDFLHAFKVVSELGVKVVGNDLISGSIYYILSPVEEPFRNIVTGWVLDDCNDFLDLFLIQLAGSLVKVDVSSLEDQV